MEQPQVGGFADQLCHRGGGLHLKFRVFAVSLLFLHLFYYGFKQNFWNRIFGPQPAPETRLKKKKGDFDIFQIPEYATYGLLMHRIPRTITQWIVLIKGNGSVKEN